MNTKVFALLIASASAVNITKLTPAIKLAESTAASSAMLPVSVEIAAGVHCKDYNWIDRYTNHTLEQCAAKALDTPAGCEDGQGVFGWKKNDGGCHCCKRNDAMTWIDKNQSWTQYQVVDEPVEEAANETPMVAETTEIAAGVHCKDYAWINRHTNYSLEQCAAQVLDTPAGCEDGQGVFGWKENDGGCHCCKRNDAMTWIDKNQNWTQYQVIEVPVEEPAAQLPGDVPARADNASEEDISGVYTVTIEKKTEEDQ